MALRGVVFRRVGLGGLGFGGVNRQADCGGDRFDKVLHFGDQAALVMRFRFVRNGHRGGLGVNLHLVCMFHRVGRRLIVMGLHGVRVSGDSLMMFGFRDQRFVV